MAVSRPLPGDSPADASQARECRVARFGVTEVMGLLGLALLVEGVRRVYEPGAWIVGGLALLTIAVLEARRPRRGGRTRRSS